MRSSNRGVHPPFRGGRAVQAIRWDCRPPSSGQRASSTNRVRFADFSRQPWRLRSPVGQTPTLWVHRTHTLVRGCGRVREPVSEETLRSTRRSPVPVRGSWIAGLSGDVMLSTAAGVSPLPADRIAADACRPADSASIEGLPHSVLLPKVQLTPLRLVDASSNPVLDPVSGCAMDPQGSRCRRQTPDRALRSLEDFMTSPFRRTRRRADDSVFDSVPSVGQPTCREDADLPAGSLIRIAARKAGYAQRNADERPPAGGKPHRHR